MMIQVQGAEIYVKESGAGEPVLFVHGNPDNADLWDEVILGLQNRYRCIAFDLPGFGRSTAPKDFDCSLSAMVPFMEDLVQALEITEPANLVVHDLGGPFGLAWAVKYPARMKRLGLINTIFFEDYHWHFWGRVWRTPLLGELSMLLMNRWIFRWEMRRGSRHITDEHIRRTYAYVTPSIKKMVLRLYRATDPENFLGWEADLLNLATHVPTLVLWGDHDPYIPVRYADRLGAREVIHFSDCGHWLPVEAADDVAAQLRRFFGS